MRNTLLLLLLLGCSFSFVSIAETTDNESTAKKRRTYWYRDVGDWIADVTVRETVMNQPSSKIITNGKRFDVQIGERMPLWTINPKNRTTGWSIGIDGGVATTLSRADQTSTGQKDLVFATETFDGHFGAYVAYGKRNYALMVRAGHLSSHLVDNSPQINNFISFSHFWTELAAVWSLTPPRKLRNWGGKLFGSIGFNWKVTPEERQPRAQLGLTLYHHLRGYDSLAIIGSADAFNQGIENQNIHWNFFIGIGYPKRAYSKKRPWRIGFNGMAGGETRNQFFSEDTYFTGVALQMEI